MSESFFEDFVHSFGFVMSFSASCAIDEMCVKRTLFAFRQFAMQIGGKPVFDFVVNSCHVFSRVKRARDEVVCASRLKRGRESHAARHWSGPTYFRWCDNPSLRSNAGQVRCDEALATLQALNAIADLSPLCQQGAIRSLRLFRSKAKQRGVCEKCHAPCAARSSPARREIFPRHARASVSSTL